MFARVRFGSLADIRERIRDAALPPKADMLSVGIDVCKVPEADMDVFASNSTRAASIEKEPGCDSRLSAMRTLRKAGARATKAGARELLGLDHPLVRKLRS